MSSHERWRVQLALDGELDASELNTHESALFNEEINVRISEAIGTVNYAEERAKQGLSSVYLDSVGNIREAFPDGSTKRLT